MDTRHAFKELTKQLLLGGYHTGRLDCLEACVARDGRWQKQISLTEGMRCLTHSLLNEEPLTRGGKKLNGENYHDK